MDSLKKKSVRCYFWSVMAVIMFPLCLGAWSFNNRTDTNDREMSSIESVLKKAKGKNKGADHSMAKIDFIYAIARKECRRYTDFDYRFFKHSICPYRFTSIKSSELSYNTMDKACVHGRNSFKKILANRLEVHNGKNILSQEKMYDYNVGFVHKHMSLRVLASSLSHLSVVKDAYDSGYQHVWILDSGTELRGDPNILSSYVQRAEEEVGDWTILYTDYSERDIKDNLKPVGRMYGRPDVIFLEMDDYISRGLDEEEQASPLAMLESGRYVHSSKQINKFWDKGLDRGFKNEYFELCDDNDNNASGATGSDSGSSGSKSGWGEIRGDEWWRASFRESYSQCLYPPNVVRINKAGNNGFIKVGLLRGAHSYILNRKGMKLILDYYFEHKIFIPYWFEIQVIPGMVPYAVPEPVTRNTNKS
jgi:hypothetical protein